eukprot:scaffold5791_cov19-Prasinocladus_malaysianus.AAC.1
MLPQSRTAVVFGHRVLAGVKIAGRCLSSLYRELAELQAKSFGCSASVEWKMYYPPTVNHEKAYSFAMDTYTR